MIKISTDQFCILGNHGVNIKSYKVPFRNSRLRLLIDIVMKFNMNVYFVNLSHIIKFCYGRSIIATTSKTQPLKKICLAIIIDEISHSIEK